MPGEFAGAIEVALAIQLWGGGYAALTPELPIRRCIGIKFADAIDL
jgi:hypothetical protein